MDKLKNFFSCLSSYSCFDNCIFLLLIIFVPALLPLVAGAIFIHIYVRTAGEKYLLTALLALGGAFVAYGKVKLFLSAGQSESALNFAYRAFIAGLWNLFIFVLVPVALALRKKL